MSLDHASISVYAVQSETGEVLIDENSELSLTPSSCMKIVTTATALHLLGTDHRFETHLEYDGAIDEAKTLHGNLYIRGGGDPCLGSDRFPNALSWEEQIEAWADAVQKLGIQRVTGKVIGDATRWEKALAVPSWKWEDLGNYYGAGACALSFHENYYSLFFKPNDTVGKSAHILRTEPPLPTLTLQNEIKTGPEGSGDQAYIFGSEFSSEQFVRGTIPAAVDEFVIKGTIPDPAAFCAELLHKQLQKKGIAFDRQEIAPRTKRTLFHTTYSPTVKEIAYYCNQKSINLHSEHLLKRMGEVVNGKGSTASGTEAVTNFWSSRGLDLAGFNMADGSGLSRNNLITTKQLVAILSEMKKSEFFPVFFESLPQKEGGMRAKSGNQSFILGYAGYTGDITFAILINQCPSRSLMKKKANLVLSELNRQAQKQVHKTL